MEWYERLNEALYYIEENLDGKVEYEKAAQIACCSTFHFQRMFSYIAGTPLAEYIRHRKLTRAAFDLQKGDKVIDVALRYGYESPTAFNRAFQNVHNVSPSFAQKEGTFLKAYPPISFIITIKGANEMDYRIVKKDAFRIVGMKSFIGKSIEESFKIVPQLWDQVSQEGKIPELLSLNNGEPIGILGVSACMDDLEQWEYYISVASDKELPNGMSEYTVPSGTWGIFSGQGPMPYSIQEMEKLKD